MLESKCHCEIQSCMMNVEYLRGGGDALSASENSQNFLGSTNLLGKSLLLCAAP